MNAAVRFGARLSIWPHGWKRIILVVVFWFPIKKSSGEIGCGRPTVKGFDRDEHERQMWKQQEKAAENLAR